MQSKGHCWAEASTSQPEHDIRNKRVIYTVLLAFCWKKYYYVLVHVSKVSKQTVENDSFFGQKRNVHKKPLFEMKKVRRHSLFVVGMTMKTDPPNLSIIFRYAWHSSLAPFWNMLWWTMPRGRTPRGWPKRRSKSSSSLINVPSTQCIWNLRCHQRPLQTMEVLLPWYVQSYIYHFNKVQSYWEGELEDQLWNFAPRTVP